MFHLYFLPSFEPAIPFSSNIALYHMIGGFPCPNLTAPTPFALTPAATPCPSPGPARTTFGLQDASSKHHPAPFISGLSALSTIKPKTVDDDRLKAREERKRQAQYTLKPRFEYAFGKWPVQELKWRLDG